MIIAGCWYAFEIVKVVTCNLRSVHGPALPNKHNGKYLSFCCLLNLNMQYEESWLTLAILVVDITVLTRAVGVNY